MSQLVVSTLCREAFERFPGVIFSKTAPSNLDEISFDNDFCYYYFSPGLEKRCSLERKHMLTGYTNAKRDFIDYAQYFADDTEVMKQFSKGGIKSFCEPWSPPGVISPIRFIYTLKTALIAENRSFMLGTFQLVDELITGETDSKIYEHNAYCPVPLLHDTSLYNVDPIPDSWFQNAFSQLPIGKIFSFIIIIY